MLYVINHDLCDHFTAQFPKISLQTYAYLDAFVQVHSPIKQWMNLAN